MNEEFQRQETENFSQVSSGQEDNKKIPQNLLRFFALLLLLIIIGVGGWYFYTQYEPPVNHLIEGVPYYGFYNLYPISFTSVAASVATISYFYNDRRLSLPDISKIFPDNSFSKEGQSQYQVALNYFVKNGYDTFTIDLAEAEYKEKEINKIKKLIQQDVPVLIRQKKRIDTKSDDLETIGWRVVIGVFDDNKEVIVHDYSLGNNYVFSYTEFKELFLSKNSFMIAAWPTEILAKTLSKPGNGLVYPKKSFVSEDIYEIVGLAGQARAFSAKAFNSCDLIYPNDPTDEQVAEILRLQNESINYRDRVINHKVFNSMPPLFQFRNKMWRAASLMRIGEVSQAREIILNELIPTNKDFDLQTSGFNLVNTTDFSDTRRTALIVDGKMPFIWEMLMLSYRYEGRYEDAIEAYLPYFELNQNDKVAQSALEELRDPKLRERIPRGVKCMGGKEMIK